VNDDSAIKALEGSDIEASRNYHGTLHNTTQPQEEPHKTGGGLLKPLIFGSLDGILPSFSIVAGAARGG